MDVLQDAWQDSKYNPEQLFFIVQRRSEEKLSNTGIKQGNLGISLPFNSLD